MQQQEEAPNFAKASIANILQQDDLSYLLMAAPKP